MSRTAETFARGSPPTRGARHLAHFPLARPRAALSLQQQNLPTQAHAQGQPSEQYDAFDSVVSPCKNLSLSLPVGPRRGGEPSSGAAKSKMASPSRREPTDRFDQQIFRWSNPQKGKGVGKIQLFVFDEEHVKMRFNDGIAGGSDWLFPCTMC